MRSKLRAELERVARKRAAAEAAAARREFEKANQVTTASWHTPPPEEVTEAQVSAAVARLAEADACGGVVATMSLAALTQAEEELAEGLEQQVANAPRVHCVCTACALRMHCVCTACALRVHCICMLCTHAARTLHAHCRARATGGGRRRRAVQGVRSQPGRASGGGGGGADAAGR